MFLNDDCHCFEVVQYHLKHNGYRLSWMMSMSHVRALVIDIGLPSPCLECDVLKGPPRWDD